MPLSTVTLLENASVFINEAIRNARRAKREARYWSFAILHLIQGLERKKGVGSLFNAQRTAVTLLGCSGTP